MCGLGLLLRIVHAMALHVVENPFSVLLFLLLDMIENLACLGVCEFKNGRIVSTRYIFFCREHVLTEGSIGVVLAGSKSRHGFALLPVLALLVLLSLLLLKVWNLAT